jgi:hypothetical protein
MASPAESRAPHDSPEHAEPATSSTIFYLPGSKRPASLPRVQAPELVLTRRSEKVAGGRADYHISINEGLIPEDQSSGKPCILAGLKRGLWEELGLESQPGYPLAITCTGLFLVWDTLEFGISYIVECPLSWDEIRRLEGRDKWLEADMVFSIPADSETLSHFLSHHKFVPHGEFILRQFINSV